MLLCEAEVRHTHAHITSSHLHFVHGLQLCVTSSCFNSKNIAPSAGKHSNAAAPLLHKQQHKMCRVPRCALCVCVLACVSACVCVRPRVVDDVHSSRVLQLAGTVAQLQSRRLTVILWTCCSSAQSFRCVLTPGSMVYHLQLHTFSCRMNEF